MKGYRTLKARTWQVVEVAQAGDRWSGLFDTFIVGLIGLNVVAVILETVQPIYERYRTFFDGFELVSVIIFSVEYLLRLWCCNADPRYVGTIRGRLRWMLTPMALVDLVAVVPFYLQVAGFDPRFMRAFRLVRILRLAKLGRYIRTLRLFGRVLSAKREELVLTTAVMLLMLVMAACTMFFAEHEAQPEAFPSIPGAMWWAMATLTTVGYGDVFPVTDLGKIVASIVAVLGIGLFALPTGILGSGFVEEIERDKRARVCPHCGEKLR